jgi:hypothetical protein
VAAAAEVLRSKKSVIANGNAQVDTAQSKFGGSSALFDGTGDYLFSPSNSDFGFGTGDFTLEGWFRFVNFTNGPALFDMRASGGTEVKPVIYCGSDGRLYYYVNGSNRITGNILSANTWYHISVSRSGTSTKMFQDGTQVGSTYTDSNNYPATVLSIGIASWNTAFNALNGHADEIRISNSARYTANFTAPTAAFVNDEDTVFLLHCDGTDALTVFEDDNGVRAKKSVRAIQQAQIDTAQSKFGGASALFDGAGTPVDHLLVNTLASDASGEITFEGWVRFAALPNTGGSGYMMWYAAGSTSYILFQNDRVQVAVTNSYYRFVFGSNFVANTWYHIAVVRESNNDWFVYRDGVKTTGAVDANDTDVNKGGNWLPTGDLIIGKFTDDRGGFNGWMDELRISNTARYTANFTAPAAPFVNDNNTVFLLHCDGTDASTYFEDDNGATPVSTRTAKTLTANGNAQIDTAQYKFGSSSYLGDGTGDYVSSPANSDYNFGTSSFTIEYWIRFNVAPTLYVPIALRASGSVFNGEWWCEITNAEKKMYWGFKNQAGTQFYVNLALAGTAFATGQWYHIALVNNAGTAQMYVNGTATGTTTALSGSFGNSTSDLWVGAGAGGYSLNGWMDEVRISNVARYTANFTAPTGAFQNDANTLLLMHMEGADASTTFTDDTLSYRTKKGIAAIGNSQVDTAQSKFGGSSLLLDGTGDYLIASPGNNFTTENFTIEFWVRFASTGANQLIASGYPAGSPNLNWAFWMGASNTFQYFLSSTGNSWSIAEGITIGTVTTNTWYHVALVRNGSTFTPYLNGVAGTTSTSSNSLYFNNTNFYIGGNASNVMNGHIDEFRISNTARYISAFTAPTAPFQNDENTLLLLHADGTDGSTVFVDDNGVTPTHQYS